jgi:hypothetical protein
MSVPLEEDREEARLTANEADRRKRTRDQTNLFFQVVTKRAMPALRLFRDNSPPTKGPITGAQTPVGEGRFSSSGSLAMFAAMRRV